MSSRPRCGAPCWSDDTGRPCENRVPREGMRCHQHRDDLPVLEEAPQPGE